MKLQKLVDLFKHSTIPGFSNLFSAKAKIRKLLWLIVICVFIYLTSHSLLEIIRDYFDYPITVNVLVSESRVLKFPAVTICNLNPVHRQRFCNNNLTKPANIEKILCASLDSLMDVCEIYTLMDHLVDQGSKICRNQVVRNKTFLKKRKNFKFSRKNISISLKPKLQAKQYFSEMFEDKNDLDYSEYFNDSDQDFTNENKEFDNEHSNRDKRQINLRTIFKAFRALSTGRINNFSEIFAMFGISDNSESFFDNIVVQLAKFAKLQINSTDDLIPALFLKSFEDSTGCQVGLSSKKSSTTSNIYLALKNLTKAFTNPKCLFKLPKLFELFSKQSKNLMQTISNCSSSWVTNLLKDEYEKNSSEMKKNKSTENSWFVLLHVLRLWLAELGRNDLKSAIKIGHNKHDLIKSCYFAGKKCNIEKDFSSFFFSTYGNCYSYNLHLTKKNTFDEEINDNTYGHNFHEESEESLTGFTGPQFGLELVLNLETANYMATTREIGAKIMVHDPRKRADPEEDAVQIQPGVVTYIGVQMLNISREKAPYTDKCSDHWPTIEQFNWAKAVDHNSYTTQLCLKLCLQYYTIKHCACWTLTSPWPVNENLPVCNVRKNQTMKDCTTEIRKRYYNEEIACNCPPRCTEEIYEKFVSTGKESRQCSALSANGDLDETTEEDVNNLAKLVIYYQSLTFNAIQQAPKYTAESLIGAVGGILGVYLGFSFLAIYEFIEIIFRSGMLICCFKTKSNDFQSSSSNQIIKPVIMPKIK